MAGSAVLGALVRPLPVEVFLRDFWPERLFHAHGTLARLPPLFSSPELMSFRVLASSYQGWLGFGKGSHGPRMVSVQQVSPLHLYEMGLSVYLPDISSSVPGAEAFLRQLEKDLGIGERSSRITVWASPKNDGAATHFDGEDVFSIQLAGSKRFEVAPMREYAYPFGAQFAPGWAAADELYPQVDNGFPDVESADFQAVDMKPGSVLFIPRGTWHRTTAAQDSFAISIGIRPPSVLESFLDQLRYLLLQDPEWRRPLYGAHGNGHQREEALERARKVLETAPDAMQAISIGDLAPVPEVERLRNIDRAARFQRELGARIDFEQGRGAEILHVTAWHPERGEERTLKLNVPAQYSSMFRWIAASKVAFTAGEIAERFPEAPFEQHQKILDVLTRARYLRLLWFPRLPRR